MIRQLVLLAGGAATRLRPLTATTAKAAVPVAGRPFLWHLLRWFRGSPVQRALLLVGHGAESIRAELPWLRALGLELELRSDGERLLGTGGALRAALADLDERFLVMNADTWPRFVWQSWFGAMPATGSALTVCEAVGGNVRLAGGAVAAYAKPAVAGGTHLDAGMPVLTRSEVAHLPAGDPSSLEYDLYPHLVASGRFAALVMDEGFVDIGTPTGLAEFTRLTAEAESPSAT